MTMDNPGDMSGKDAPPPHVVQGLPDGPHPPLWPIVRASIDDAIMLGKTLPGWSLALFGVGIVCGRLSVHFGTAARPHSAWPFFIFAIEQVVTLPFTFRFVGALLKVDNPGAFAPQVWMRLLGWGIFCIFLSEAAHANVLPYSPPSAVNAVLFVGAAYFRVRLMPLYPALMAWPEWPGIDRIWNACRTFTLPLIGWLTVLYLPVILVVLVAIAAVTGLPSVNSPASGPSTEHLRQGLIQATPLLALIEAAVLVASTLFSAALSVRIFRLIAR